MSLVSGNVCHRRFDKGRVMQHLCFSFEFIILLIFAMLLFIVGCVVLIMDSSRHAYYIEIVSASIDAYCFFLYFQFHLFFSSL